MTYEEIKRRLVKCEKSLQQLKQTDLATATPQARQKAQKAYKVINESITKYKALLLKEEKTYILTPKDGKPTAASLGDDEVEALKDADDIAAIKSAEGDEIKEQEGIEFSVQETTAIAKKVGKALAMALKAVGDDVTSMKAKNIEENSFEIYVQYKNGSDDQFSFYISEDTLHLVDFSFDKELVDVGVKPSGEAIVNVDLLSNELQKHFKSMSEDKVNEAPEGMFYIKVAVRDARKALAMIDDQPALKHKVEISGSDTYYLSDEGLAYDLMMDFNANDIEVIDTNIDEDNLEEYKSDYARRRERESDYYVSKKDKPAKAYKEPKNDYFARRKKELDYKYGSAGQEMYQEGDVDAEMDGGDLDVGHQDDEPNMLKKEIYDIITYAAKLYKQLDKYDQHDGEVDFPQWWQKKVILARSYMSAAQHYLEGEEKQPAIDQLALEGKEAEGQMAATKGKKYDENPYKKGTKDHLEWSKGHNQARASKASLNEYTDDTFSGAELIKSVSQDAPDMFGKKLLADILPKGVASEDEAVKALHAHDKSGIKQRMGGRFAPMFVHVQYHDLEHEGETYRLHNKQYYNSNFKDKDPDFNPQVSKITLIKVNDADRYTKNTENLGSILVKTDAYVQDVRDLESQGKLGDRHMEEVVKEESISTHDPSLAKGILDMVELHAATAGLTDQDAAKEVVEFIQKNFSTANEGSLEEGTELYNRNGFQIKRFSGGEKGVMVQITIGDKYIVVSAADYPFLVRAMQSVQGDLKDMNRQYPRSKNADEATKKEEEKFHKNLDTLVHKTFGKRKEELEEDWGGSDQYAMNQSIHKDLGEPTKMPSPFDDQLRSAAEAAVDFYWDDWEEYKTDREGLVDNAVRSYLRSMFRDSWDTMVRMFEPADESKQRPAKGERGGAAKLQKAYGLVVSRMKELAKQYKAGDTSVIDELKELTAKKKAIEKSLEAAVAGINRNQSLDEAKATCCGKCGRVHVKGTECKRPYLKGKDHCRYN